MAAGYSDNASPDQTLIEEWNGHIWSLVNSPNRSLNLGGDLLHGVTCTSSSFCMAAGEYYNGSHDQTLIERWKGGSWSLITSPNTSSTEENNLTSVSCTSSSFCMAAGEYYIGTTWQTLTDKWNGSSWKLVASPDTSSTQENDLNGLTCSSTSFCMAVGKYYNGSNWQTLIERW
jgi:uncharacterized protein YuzB (UPF0349 family)